MSDTNTNTDTDTSAIDNKKTPSANAYTTKLINYIKSVAQIVLHVFIYFMLGSLVLYGCKLGQSNILPTEENCHPNQEIKANIFTTLNIFKNEQMSMKIVFPYDDYNASNTLLDKITEYRESNKSFFLINYFLSIFEDLTRFNYTMLNYILNILNQVPEMLSVLLGPIVLVFLSVMLLFFDFIYFIYLWFSKMSWFFKHNAASDSNSDKAKWEDISIFSPIGYMCAIALVFIFFISFFFMMPLASPIVLIVLINCILSLCFYKAELNGEKVGFLRILKDVFKYYKLTIMTVLSIFIVLSTFSNLGTTSGIFCVVVLTAIYFGVIGIRMFKTETETHLSPLTSYDQAKKTCQAKEQKKSGFFSMFFGGQNGGSITKELKKLGKNKK